VFAAAEENGLRLGGIVFDRSDAGAGVGSIAEGLIGALAAGAPVVAVTGLDGSGKGRFLRNYGF
jgi:hypothetical protein